MEEKSIFKSKTFWFSIIEAVGGALLVVGEQYPIELGWAVVAAGVITFVLRLVTKQPVSI